MVHSSSLIVTIITVFTFIIDVSVSENNGNNGGCFYKGEHYSGNWTDGCDFNCTCVNPETGHYKCTTRCPTFREIPQGCVLTLPPGEECCKQPDCRTLTSYHSNNNDVENGDKNTTTTTDGNNHPENTTDNDTVKGCYYKGQHYHGNWTDGCQIACHCQDPIAGLYDCVDRCKEQYDTSQGCETKSTGNDDCCPDPACNTTESRSNDDNPSTDGQQGNLIDVTTIVEPTAKPEVTVQYKSVTPEVTPEVTTASPNRVKETHRLAAIFSQFGPVNLFAVKTNKKDAKPKSTNHQPLLPGVDYIPTSTENKPLVKQPLAFGLGGLCFYKGINYTQDERWYDGCKYLCTCLNAKYGEYQCIDRCQKYNGLPVGCSMKISKHDKCCLVPDCRYGSVVRRERVHDAHWITSSLFRLKFPQSAKLRQMFNKRMELKTSDIRNRQPVNYSLLSDKKNTQPANKKGNVIHTTVYAHERPSSRFAGSVKPTKRPIRFSDVFANVKAVKEFEGKRFTDYKIPNSKNKPDAIHIITKNGGEHSIDTNKSTEGVTTKNYLSTKGHSKPLDTLFQNVNNSTNTTLDHYTDNQYVIRTNETVNIATDDLKPISADSEVVVEMVKLNDSAKLYARAIEPAIDIESADNSIGYIVPEALEMYNHKDIGSVSNVNIVTIEDSKNGANGSYTKPVNLNTLHNDDNSSDSLVSNPNVGLNEIVKNNSSFNSSDNVIPKPFLSETEVQELLITFTPNETDKEQVKSDNRATAQHENLQLVLLRKLMLPSQEVVQQTTEAPLKTEPLYRTIRTNTGVYKVSVKDGTIVPARQPLLGVLGKMLQSISRRQTKTHDPNTKGNCEYKGNFYKRGELWFDQCDYVCKCDSYGRHTCQQRCPQHEYIPKGCVMLKPKSKACCDILVCKNTTVDKHLQLYTEDQQVG